MSAFPARTTADPGPIALRRFAEGDSLESLTAMLQRAFSRLGQMGLNCSCTHQSAEVTGARIGKGDCFVAVCNGQLVGTITLYRPDPASESRWYQRPEVGSVHQFGVDPAFQNRGVGKALLTLAENWARSEGYSELALDTPHPARHLVDFYIACGYRPIESVRFAERRYVSIVLTKDLVMADVATGANCAVVPLRCRGSTVSLAVSGKRTRRVC